MSNLSNLEIRKRVIEKNLRKGERDNKWKGRNK